ncbi:MAG: TIGR01777 family oxidoreductase [Pseudomonadota bacterium]
MKILITGGTGLIGRALCARLGSHDVTVFSRVPSRVTELCGNDVRSMSSLDDWIPSASFDAVINLAGEPIVGRRWSEARKNMLRDSRIGVTAELLEKMQSADVRPQTFISGSAIGLYGDCGSVEIDESSPAASDFGATLCRDWEQAALKAADMNIRTCAIRTGLVLSADGGVLKQMLLPFRLGLGSRIGSGSQWMSWIHIQDQVGAILHLLHNDSCEGAYNLTAPEPVTNSIFTKQLASAVNRPSFLVTPKWALDLLLGESAMLLTGGQRVLPSRLLESGYRFRYPELRQVLNDLLN